MRASLPPLRTRPPQFGRWLLPPAGLCASSAALAHPAGDPKPSADLRARIQLPPDQSGSVTWDRSLSGQPQMKVLRENLSCRAAVLGLSMSMSTSMQHIVGQGFVVSEGCVLREGFVFSESLGEPAAATGRSHQGE